MLKSIDSRELQEWVGFERINGPIGGAYQQMVLREVLDQLRYLNYLTGAQFEDNPVPRPGKPYPTPEEFMHIEQPDPESEQPQHASPDEIDSFLGF